MTDRPKGSGAVPWLPGGVAPAPRVVAPAPPLTAAQRTSLGREVQRVLHRPERIREDWLGNPLPPSAPKAEPKRQVLLTPMGTVKVERMEWLLRGMIPLRTVTVVAGRGGEGKSTWMCGVAARSTRLRLDGEVQGGPVLIIGHEDDKATVLLPRLLAAGADVEQVTAMAVVTTVDAVTSETIPVLPLDVALIRDAIIATGARLVIIDPLTSSIDGNPDRLADVRRALDPLAALAAELNVAIVVIMHLRKGAGNTSDLLSGSHAFRDVARSVLLMATDENTGNKVLTVEKSNYSEGRGDSFAFRLETVEVPTDDGDITTVARAVDLGASDVSVDDIVNRADDLANLGDTSAALAEVVNRHPEEKGIEIGQAAIEAGVDHDLARRYLLRLAKSGRIEKAGRGRYRAKGTPTVRVVPSVPSALLEP